MGAFYGSVHLRTDDQQAVCKLVGATVKKQPTRFLIGPALGGWVAVYPQDHGQDPRVAPGLARRFPGEVLYVMVHDDDLFAYAFYRDGRLLDQYRSCRDYDDDDEAGEECGGRAEVFRHLLPDDGAVERLRQVLAERPLFAGESLGRFAEILGLRNALTSYEYLQYGETDGVEGLDQFVHVPDQAADKARKRAAATDAATARERLRAEGLLLVERPGPALAVTPAWCPDREGSGFFNFHTNRSGRADSPIDHDGPPWTGPQPVAGILVPRHTRVLELSPSGRYLAVGDGAGKARLWDLDRREVVVEFAHSRHVVWAGFDPAEKYLITLAYQEGVITSLDGGRRIASFPMLNGKTAAVHPSGTLVVAQEVGSLTFLELPSGRQQKTLWAGGQANPPTALRRPPGAVALQRMGAAEMEARIKQAVEQQLAQAEALHEKVRAAYRKAGLPEPADLKERMRQEMQKIMEMARPQLEHVAAAARPDGTVPVAALQAAGAQGGERITDLGISGDGRWLFYATQEGVRVLAWDDVTAARDATPAPAFAAASEPVRVEYRGTESVQRHTYTLAHDGGTDRLLFAGLEGKVRFLDLADGSVGVVLDPPGRPPILRLGLSRDRSALACTCMPGQFEGPKGRPPLFQVWNYAALTEPHEDPPIIRFPG